MTEPQKRPLPVRIRRSTDGIPMNDLFRSDPARPTRTAPESAAPAAGPATAVTPPAAGRRPPSPT
ncbi:hypothetical protein ACFVIY_26245 [Streptomyces sp. NPDC127166]|uniref:hypothetical protein n=1 Tax=Streptomyces sp. NPDC127166 TaxID=3345380 RepID=UPI0036368817